MYQSHRRPLMPIYPSCFPLIHLGLSLLVSSPLYILYL